MLTLTTLFTLCLINGLIISHGIQGYPELSSSSGGNRALNNTIEIVSTTIVASSPLSSSSSSSPSRDNGSVKYKSGNNTDEIAAREFLRTQEIEAVKYCRKGVLAEWSYSTNLTEYNKQAMLNVSLEQSKFTKESWLNATSFAWKNFSDPTIRRWFKSLSVLGNGVLDGDKLTQLNELTADMEDSYSSGKVCPYSPNKTIDRSKCNLNFEPDITRIMDESRNYEELKSIWSQWRDVTGKTMRSKYLKYVQLSNEAAQLNGFADAGDLWRAGYESDTLVDDLETIWKQLEPLYKLLHAYTRKRLINLYGEDKIKRNGPIPAHILGNMWGQSWSSLRDILIPFPDKPSVDITDNLIAKNISVVDIFKISEAFFTSLGLKPMTDKFWNNSIIERPADGRDFTCHASAWDFCGDDDVRIKMCTDRNMKNFIVVHHEMGHIQYYLQYKDQPYVFRTGANPGFHEAVGDTLALSVSTPSHLKAIGLLDEISSDPEGDLNHLMSMALDKIAFLPSGYLMDKWRWEVFANSSTHANLNKLWWKYRLRYQGLCPPVRRTEDDFDPGSKYHIAASVPYIRYFVSYIIQFQFHKALCEAANNTGPLYQCDIYQSREAGQLLSNVLSLGASKHWSEALKMMTGSEKMSAEPLLQYFAPLIEWMKTQVTPEEIGWTSADPMICP
ncbi:angiotensin-converting enzyme-like [Panonychus citri]|uniref:angiotensin-converting enzyme-like n=1 Tax=Panonychus citri TaxID=50023 RepID=UPI002306EB4B|nr:angiotensin-converting enzyme-like [Panonychus citri]